MKDQMEEAVSWAEQNLGAHSAEFMRTAEAAAEVESLLRAGSSTTHAVLTVINHAGRTHQQLENEFAGYVLPIALKKAQRFVNSVPHLKAALEADDLAVSMVGTLFPGVHSIEFRSEEHFIAQIARRIKNKALDHYRRLTSAKRAEQRRVGRTPHSLDVAHAPSADDPARLAMTQEARDILETKIGLLPEKTASLVRRSMSGATAAEIAAERDLTPDAARMAISRAWNELYRLMRQHYRESTS